MLVEMSWEKSFNKNPMIENHFLDVIAFQEKTYVSQWVITSRSITKSAKTLKLAKLAISAISAISAKSTKSARSAT